MEGNRQLLFAERERRNQRRCGVVLPCTEIGCSRNQGQDCILAGCEGRIARVKEFEAQLDGECLDGNGIRGVGPDGRQHGAAAA